MKFKNPFKKATLNTTKDNSLEELLLSIEESNPNLSKYKKNILEITSEQILRKIEKEDIKDLSDKNNETEKRSWKSQKNAITWTLLFGLIIFLQIIYMFYLENYNLLTINLLGLFLFTFSGIFCIRSHIKFIYQEFILNRKLRKNKEKILLNISIKEEINNIFKSIKITKQDTIKNEMLSYILEDKNIKTIENKLKDKIIYQHKKDIENKLIKIGNVDAF